VALMDRSLVLRRVNATLSVMSHRTPDELVGQHALEIAPALRPR
jgi:hypothetical protein